MDIIGECAKLAKQFEGLHDLHKDGLVYPYRDPVGYPTIGYGNLLSTDKDKSLSSWKPRAVAQCEHDLRDELKEKHDMAIELSPCLAKDKNAWRLVAITDFIFNIGQANYEASTLKQKVDAENWTAAQEQIKRWNHAGGKVLAGLTTRRNAEAELLGKEC